MQLHEADEKNSRLQGKMQNELQDALAQLKDAKTKFDYFFTTFSPSSFTFFLTNLDFTSYNNRLTAEAPVEISFGARRGGIQSEKKVYRLLHSFFPEDPKRR